MTNNHKKPDLSNLSEGEINKAVSGLDENRRASAQSIRDELKNTIDDHMGAVLEAAMSFKPKSSISDLTDEDKARMQFIIQGQLERDIYKDIVKKALTLVGVEVSSADAVAIQDDLIQDPTIFYTLMTPHLKAVLDDGTRSPFEIADIGNEALIAVYTEIMPSPAVEEFFKIYEID